MAAFQQALQDATSKNRELLFELRETDYATPALKQTMAYVADLKTQIATADKELQRLAKITQDERKDHLKYQDSVMKRYAYKMSGKSDKFVSRQAKEEREFLEAYQREREAKEYRESLVSALEKAEGEKRKQEVDVARHDTAQAELDRMYNAIFSGPTPDVPGEDELEQAVKNAREWFQQCEMRSGNEGRAFEGVERARKWLWSALRDMDSARGHSQMDMFGGGTFTDMLERDALSRAQNNLTQCLRTLDEARRFQPAIPQLSEVTIDHGHMISDVLFDNIFTDMAQHERIKNSQAQMLRARDHLESIRQEQLQTTQNAKSQLTQASNQLEEARKELQQTRSEAFERFAGTGNGVEDQAPPPAYTA